MLRNQGKAPVGQTVVRYLFLAAGIVLMALAGLFFSCSAIGMDPLSVFYSGVSAVLHIRLGSAAFLVGCVILLILLFWDRAKIGIGTVAVVLGIGPLLNLFLRFFSYTPSGWVGKGASSLAGVAAFGLGMAFYLHADLGCGPVDALMLHFSERSPVPLRTFKVLFDILCVIIGALLGGIFGIGTILAALLTGPAMCAVMKLLDCAEASQRNEVSVSHEAGIPDHIG